MNSKHNNKRKIKVGIVQMQSWPLELKTYAVGMGSNPFLLSQKSLPRHSNVKL